MNLDDSAKETLKITFHAILLFAFWMFIFMIVSMWFIEHVKKEPTLQIIEKPVGGVIK
jgi:hypothetical protein